MNFSDSYESADGSKRQEAGELKDVVGEDSKPHSVVVMRGSYEYPGADGKPVVVQYYADETGFHAEGDSIPKPARR
ncbi:Cuticle protein 4 [Operophtera brumata]|uniref:Cuticle protein 4 n=1 Tax=Operophtera brumata TaxID=104452 RepID=A0A0L7LSJ9_OPEBR|nr:Cuticle protein 4 [Operophtera brumata]